MSPMNHEAKKKLNNKGFSLIELIIVVAIMAVLIGVLAPQYLKYVEKSRESADLQAIDSMVSAVEIYAASNEVSGDLGCDSTGKLTASDSVLAALKDAGLVKNAVTEISLKSKVYKQKWEITFSADDVTTDEDFIAIALSITDTSAGGGAPAPVGP